MLGPSSPPSHSEGIFEALKGCVATWISLLRTRLEILSTELEEEKIRLAQIAILGAVALFGLFFGLILLTFFVIACFWPTEYRLWVFAAFTILYLAVGFGCLLAVKAKARVKPRLFQTTLSELAKDERQLSSNP